jgi:hypothetical protein
MLSGEGACLFCAFSQDTNKNNQKMVLFAPATSKAM